MNDQLAAAADMPLTRASAVADQLRKMIVSGELVAGQRLRQTQFADHFGVSTTPIREAFTMLAREGIVRQDAHRGVIVFAASKRDVEENFAIRARLEPYAAELAAVAITERDLSLLSDLADEMSVAMKSDLARHTEVLNPQFHKIINDAAGMPRLSEIIGTLRASARSYHGLITPVTLDGSYGELVDQEHHQIAAALRARDPEAAAGLVRQHIEHNLEQVLARLNVSAD